MIHDLYPVPIEERVMQALDTVRPYMESHGGNVELLGIEDGVAKLRLEGSCKSCRASSSTLELAVRQALEEAAPDLLGMDVEGVVEEEEVTGVALADGQRGALMAHRSTSPPQTPSPQPPSTTSRSSSPTSTARCSRTGTRAPTAAAHLTAVRWRAARLTCPGCGRSYFLPQAGRSMDDDHLQLQPIPLLREAEGIKVAL